MTIKTIAFDGIHRSGKNTQIKLLQEKIQKLWYEVFSIRWEYYREWNWENNLLDPYSDRWQKNKTNNNYDEKSQRLQRELYYFFNKKLPEYCKNNNIDKSVVFLERSIVWKYLFKSWEWEINKNSNYFSQKKNNTQNINNSDKFIKEIIIPEIIFVLQPSKEELLKRLLLTEVDNNKLHQSIVWENNNTERDKARLEYKKLYIPQKYDLYYNWLSQIPEHIYKKIHHIKSDADQETIHQEIMKKIGIL